MIPRSHPMSTLDTTALSIKPFPFLRASGHRKKPTPEHSQDQKGPLLKSWLFLRSALTIQDSLLIDLQTQQSTTGRCSFKWAWWRKCSYFRIIELACK